jgi:solute carrier family 38 (sodium-coupled neutral amino acid transporter), member 11
MTQAGKHGEDLGLLAGGDHNDNDLPLEAAHSADVERHGQGGSNSDSNSNDGHNGAARSPGQTNGNGVLKGMDGSEVMTPRTAHRVRFDLTPEFVGGNGAADYTRRSTDTDASSLDFDMDMEDPQSEGGGRRGGRGHRVPLLTDMEAPSVAVANSWDADGDDEDWAAREMRRPKSGMRSAFMNMANSIIGAGIIGQPYAMRQAGLLSGTLLLVGLTVLIDWTICLIVINSKLSGTNSFQGTVEYCFGKPGLIAISLAQWLFAFGGMVAFGVIVGDTIPHVLMAVWPDLVDIPVLGLLANRRIAIAVFIMGVSYPLTLYRDIAKVSFEFVKCA